MSTTTEVESEHPKPVALDSGKVVHFLGIADHFQGGIQPFPIGGVDIFQLAQHKSHIVFPAILSGCTWLILVSSEFLRICDLTKWKLRIVHEDGSEIGISSLARLPVTSNAVPEMAGRPDAASKPTDQRKEKTFELLFPADTKLVLLPISFEACTVSNPGECTVQSIYDGHTEDIGAVTFYYQPTPNFTSDQIKAIEADPGAAKVVRMELGCKLCPTKLSVYAGVNRSPKLEKEGSVWYSDLQGDFECECGKAKYSLQYLRESAHGMLLKDFSLAGSGVSYARQYGHEQIKSIAKEFVALLNTTELEQPIQAFIEKYPLLLSKFNARRLFVKPSILGKFAADFAIIDPRNHLWLIEIERPSIPLFRKKDGHPTAKLMHAYEQVADWVHQFHLHSVAILDTLKLKSDEVVTVKGVVVAGRSTNVSHEVLQRHLSNPPYPNVDFMTLDDLAISLINLSRKLV